MEDDGLCDYKKRMYGFESCIENCLKRTRVIFSQWSNWDI